MDEQSRIPVSKVQRATKFIKTGAKVGKNYVVHYAKKMTDPSLSKDQLHEDNAKDVYESLSELKGSALKVAQMLSMDKNLLPNAYQNKFAMSQYSAPPLSYPLVVKTFQKRFGKTPEQIFNSFTKNAVNAASIGQVHMAMLDGKKLAVKIQYPGVATSISSDLKMVKPIALRMFNLNETELSVYLEEVESKLMEETDYDLELGRSVEIGEACSHIDHLVFPKYYPEFSGDKILTMDWLDGTHLKEFLKTNPSQKVRNQIGQALWDFYHHQIHNLKQVHADPHPGNFLMREDGKLGIIDFGCVKIIPEDFYENYFIVMRKDIIQDQRKLMKVLTLMNFIYDDDTVEMQRFYLNLFSEMIQLLGKPFQTEYFDFSDKSYFQSIYDMSEKLQNMKELKNSKHPRGSRHGLYINRTYFGLYTILHDLEADISTTKPDWLTQPSLEIV